MHNWLWHLFNDPMRDNPWALLCMLVLMVAMFSPAWWPMLRDRKDRGGRLNE